MLAGSRSASNRLVSSGKIMGISGSGATKKEKAVVGGADVVRPLEVAKTGQQKNSQLIQGAEEFRLFKPISAKAINYLTRPGILSKDNYVELLNNVVGGNRVQKESGRVGYMMETPRAFVNPHVNQGVSAGKEGTIKSRFDVPLYSKVEEFTPKGESVVKPMDIKGITPGLDLPSKEVISLSFDANMGATQDVFTPVAFGNEGMSLVNPAPADVASVAMASKKDEAPSMNPRVPEPHEQDAQPVEQTVDIEALAHELAGRILERFRLEKERHGLW